MAASCDHSFLRNLPNEGDRLNRIPKPLKIALFLAPFFLVAGLIAAKSLNRGAYWRIAGVEDGPIEWLTALFYLIAAAATLLLVARFRAGGLQLHAALSGVLALGLFFIGMEELSWGQRVFGISSPDLMIEINRQQELNLHNIGGNTLWLDLAFIAVTAYALTASLWVPALSRTLLGGRFASLAPLVSPPGFLAPYFLVPFLLYSYYVANPLLVDLFGPGAAYEIGPGRRLFVIARDQEPSECILGIGFLLFSVWLLFLQAIGAWRRPDAALSPAWA